MRRILIAAPVLAAGAGFAVFWGLTAPQTEAPAALIPEALSRTGPAGAPVPAPDFTPDAARGELLFAAAGCESCHLPPAQEGAGAQAESDAGPHLAGGMHFATEFGTFIAPNISPHPQDGIGGWSDLAFVNAVLHGVSPDGAHYYPAFPYVSYARMTPGDALDLLAYIRTLPPVEGAAPPHEVGFPFNIRRGLGLWKLLYADASPVLETDDPQIARGRFLVEGPGHCAECHTPRDAFGGLDRAAWLTGAPNPDGPGRVPDISPSGLGDWSAEDVAYYLSSGFTPEYDSVGGAMAAVVEHMAKLPEEDRAAIAAYLKALPEG